MDVLKISRELKNDLKLYYGTSLSRLVLFGSYARKDFSDDSDLDYLLVLKDSDLNAFREIAKVTSVLESFLLRYGKVFSLTATSEEKYLSFGSSFYESVRKEGIEIE
jgi:predicted nucleotidyltransferase